MIRIIINGLENAINRIVNISSNIFEVSMNGLYDTGLTLKEKIESIEPKYRGKLEVLPDPSIPGVIILAPPEVGVKEIGHIRVGYMRKRCPKELYFETELKKYIEPSNVFARVVEENKEFIRENIISYLKQLIG